VAALAQTTPVPLACSITLLGHFSHLAFCSLIRFVVDYCISLASSRRGFRVSRALCQMGTIYIWVL